MCTFISGETTAETDQQRIRVDLFKDRNNLYRVSLILQPALFVLAFDVFDQFIFQSFAQFPDIVVVDVLDSFPKFFVGLVFKEFFTETLVEETFP